MYVRFFNELGTGSVPTEFSGRSDYGPFVALNVPAGGLFTGAEGLKTEEGAEMFGGIAGAAYDPNYHQVGDTIGNVDRDALTANLAAIQHSVIKYARSTRTVNGDTFGHEVPEEATVQRSVAGSHSHGGAHDHNDVVAK